jgi:NADH-quinone oxidoreductase subunit I
MSARTPRRKYWNEPRLGAWERSYLPEILRGLKITGGVFLSNMWKWVTFRKGALTAYYPEEIRADYSPNNRGRHVLTQRPDGSAQCVACNMCATVCPAYCIEIEAAADFDDTVHPKSPVRFEIDYSRCIFCGFCVEACPEDAIRMVKDTPDLPSFERDRMWARIDLLKNWRPTKDPRKPYPPEGGAR